MPQLSGGGGDPELCATDEMIPFKDEGDPQKEQIFAELSHSEEEGDLADIKSSLVHESESSPNSNSHDVSNVLRVFTCMWWMVMRKRKVGINSELQHRAEEMACSSLLTKLFNVIFNHGNTWVSFSC